MLTTAACSGDGHATLSGDLATLVRHRPTLELLDDGQTLRLEYSPFASGCFSLDRPIAATVNGEPLTAISTGGGFADGELADGDQCTRPSWSLQRRPTDEAMTAFVLRDATATLGADLLAVSAPRAVALASADPVRPGQDLALIWSPATDTPFVAVNNLYGMSYAFVRPDGGAEPWYPAAPTAAAGSLVLDVPASASGDGELVLAGRYVTGVASCTPAGLTCVGRGKISATSGSRVSVALTVVP